MQPPIYRALPVLKLSDTISIRSGDLIRVTGEGARLFRVRRITLCGHRLWVDAWGPVDKRGTKMPDASYRSFAVSRVGPKPSR
jgi:hypothetical protein